MNEMATSTGITCSICVEVYNLDERKPLLLPCSHSFCRNCIQQMQTNNKSCCPQCRKSWTGQSIDKLPLIRQLVHSSENRENKKFRFAHNGRTCISHNDEFVMWCKNCEESICNHCLLEKHQKCDWIHIKEKTTEPMKGSSVPDGTDVAEPTDGTDVAEPTDGTDVAEPSDHADVAEPTDMTDVAEPTDETDVAEPTDGADMAAPTDGTYVAEPTDGIDFSEPTTDGIHSEISSEESSHTSSSSDGPSTTVPVQTVCGIFF